MYLEISRKIQLLETGILQIPLEWTDSSLFTFSLYFYRSIDSKLKNIIQEQPYHFKNQITTTKMSNSVVSAMPQNNSSQISSYSTYTSFITRDERTFLFALKLQHFIEQKLDSIRKNIEDNDDEQQAEWENCLNQLISLSTDEYEKVLPSMGDYQELKQSFKHLFVKYIKRSGIIDAAVHIRVPQLAYVVQNFTVAFCKNWKIKEFDSYIKLSHEDKQSIVVDVLREVLYPLAKQSIVGKKPTSTSSVSLKDKIPDISHLDSVSLVGTNNVVQDKEDAGASQKEESKVSVLVNRNKLAAENLNNDGQPTKKEEEEEEVRKKVEKENIEELSSVTRKKRRKMKRKRLLEKLIRIMEDDEDEDTTVV